MATDQDGAADDDARFAELIQDEFGVAVNGPATSEDAAHALATPAKPAKPGRRTRRPKPDTIPQWFSLDQAIDEAEPDVEPFVPPETTPLPRPRSPLAILGVALLVVAVVIGAAWLFGAPVPIWLRGTAGVLVGAALAALLLSLPRHKPDLWDDGAVL
ncbi:MAG: DUF6234 family protein [Propionibacteriaceae bacterium]|nr:DUF6234 family protein [Propionibacteriaceae bacterium]